MAHVHGEKAAAQIKSVGNAGAAKMMDPSMGKMAMGPMMTEGMGPVMKEGMKPMMHEGMGSMMMAGMGPMMKSPGVVTSAATGAVVTAGSSAGKSVIRRFFTHPLVLFGLGVAAGYYLHKYRKSIISTSDEEQEE